MSNTYYTASILFEGKRSDGKESLWEERFYLVSATDEEEVLSKAKDIAACQEVEFKVESGATVKWCYSKIMSIFLVDDDLSNGAELFSRHLTQNEVESLKRPFNDD